MSLPASHGHTPFYVKKIKAFFKGETTRTRTSMMSVMLAGVIAVSTITPAAADPSGISDIGFTGPVAISSAGGGWDLVNSGYSMDQMDPFSSMITGDQFGQTLSSDYAMQTDLMSTNQMALDAGLLAEESRREAEIKRLADEAKKKAAAEKAAKEAKEAGVSTAAAGGNYDSTSCPTTAPANTLRDGSASVGIAQLCARSVAGARSPQAAQAIIYTFNNLGVPYSQATRNKQGWFDCSSYTSRAYQSAGVNIAPPGQNAPTTRSMRASRWAVQIGQSELMPGDLVQPTNGHVAMQLADGWVIHTNRPGDVSHVRKGYSKIYWAAYVDPARV